MARLMCKHRKYLGKRPPRVSCQWCWGLYLWTKLDVITINAADDIAKDIVRAIEISRWGRCVPGCEGVAKEIEKHRASRERLIMGMDGR